MRGSPFLYLFVVAALVAAIAIQRAERTAYAHHISTLPTRCPGVLSDYHIIEPPDGDTAGLDTYVLTAANDLVFDTSGASTVVNTVDGGNDCVVTGIADDNITTGSGNDTIDSGGGTNVINAGNGVNRVVSGGGGDRITTGSGSDTIDSGGGINVINAGNGNNRVTSGAGPDSITTGNGFDTVFSGAGNDNPINTGAGADCIEAGDGTDVINSGLGLDVVDPGIGGGSITDPDQSPPPSGDCNPDADNDRIPDATDNCDFVANATQTDTDGDQIGDACDVVVDNTPPSVICGADITVEATGPGGATVGWLSTQCTASDLVDAGVTDCVEVPASGSTFALGETTVTCSVTDASGNTGSDSFKVTVEDTTPPVVRCGDDIAVEPRSISGAFVRWLANRCTAEDVVDGTVECDYAPAAGSLFALGTTQVTCTATDDEGNGGTARFDVSVLFDFDGFFRPLAMNDFNDVKAGGSVPIKFSLNGYFGLNVFKEGYPKSIRIPCEREGVTPREAVAVNAGRSSLSYDSLAYGYVWKTDKLWADTCRQLQVKLADGTVVTANFRFKK